MADRRMDDIMGRLAALEADRNGGARTQPRRGPGPRGISDRSGEDGGPPGPPGLGIGFDEKRVVDLIVSLVVEQVDQLLDRRLVEARRDQERQVSMIAREVERRRGKRKKRDSKRRKERDKKRKKDKRDKRD